jgi:ubiquinone biosynthesis protein COQ9
MDNKIKDKILKAIEENVVFEGWSDKALKAAMSDSGVKEELVKKFFPRGVLDVAIAFHQQGDKKMIGMVKKTNLVDLRLREKIAFAVKCRLQAIDGQKEIIRRGVSFFALPPNFLEGSKLIWNTSDSIWNLLGDTSDDYNFYTKRASLSGVYGAVILFWLGDESDNNEETWDFLNRRINNIMQFEKFKASVRSDPLGSKVFKSTEGFLAKVRRPSTQTNLDLPGILRRP